MTAGLHGKAGACYHNRERDRLASWHFHNHISLRLLGGLDIPLEHREAFHLGCFAPDLVRRSADKTRSHFTTDVGAVPFWLFSMRRFGHWAATHDPLTPRRRWFLRGYGVHLLVDRCWIQGCVYPFLARQLVHGRTPSASGDAYYADMRASDGYHRHRAPADDYVSSLAMLRRVDPGELLPPSLERTKVADLISLLEKTRRSTSAEYQARYIPWRRVTRFLDRSLAICERYLRSGA